MPTYDYHCTHNDRTVEVRHPMNLRLHSWGELCALAGIDPDGAPHDAPVEKVLGTGGVVHSANLGSGTAPPCATGPCCGGGMCGMPG
ncbi:MAG: zinc ribbon domain-containing protein [Gammaproteobacteria bacterium]